MVTGHSDRPAGRAAPCSPGWRGVLRGRVSPGGGGAFSSTTPAWAWLVLPLASLQGWLRVRMPSGRLCRIHSVPAGVRGLAEHGLVPVALLPTGVPPPAGVCWALLLRPAVAIGWEEAGQQGGGPQPVSPSRVFGHLPWGTGPWRQRPVPRAWRTTAVGLAWWAAAWWATAWWEGLGGALWLGPGSRVRVALLAVLPGQQQPAPGPPAALAPTQALLWPAAS